MGAPSLRSGGTESVFDYSVPVDPMDELHCESCQ